MGLISNFFPRPYPLGGRIDVADDCLSAVSDVDVLNRHLLLAASPSAASRPGELGAIARHVGVRKAPSSFDAQVGGKPALRQSCENAGGPKLIGQ
jgi:hypothetical protein